MVEKIITARKRGNRVRVKTFLQVIVSETEHPSLRYENVEQLLDKDYLSTAVEERKYLDREVKIPLVVFLD